MRSIRLSLCAALLMLLPRVAAAQVAGPVYVFVRGTVADPDQVNSDFSTIYGSALNRTGGTMTGTLNTLNLLPTVTNASDAGSATFFYRTYYARTSFVLGQATANYTLTWSNPASARAISIPDPGGTDVFVFAAMTQTLTGKTLTTPTLTNPTINGATLTGTLAGTPTFSGVFTDSALGTHSVSATGAGAQIFLVRNSTAGTTNSAEVRLGNDSLAQSASLQVTSSTYTGIAAYGGGVLALRGLDSGGTIIAAENASAGIKLFTGGTASGNLRWGVNSAGDLVFGSSSHIAMSNGTPTVTGFGGGGVGTTAGVTGTDYAMQLGTQGVPGNAFTTSITVAFGHTFSSTPVVIVTPVTNAANRPTDLYTSAVSTTGFTVNYTGNGSSCTVSGCPFTLHVVVLGS